MADFKLPDLGEGVTEAEIDRWLVNEGDTIAEDDPLVEVITDKATAEIPSPYAGVVTRIHVSAGSVVPVGTVLVSIGSDGDAPEAPAAGPQVATGVAAGPPPPPPDEVAPTAGGGRAVEALPPVRRRARELGIDLSRVPASGPDGRILREDVEAFAARSVGTPPA